MRTDHLRQFASRRRPLPAFSLILAGLFANPASAWDFSGFASFGGGVLNRDNLTFLDYNDRPSFDSDTIIGAQLQQDFAEQWRFTTQIVSRGYRVDGHSDYEPDLEWLFLTYQWSADFRVRAGKLRTPIFLRSEDLEVGYAYPWVRPPVDIYQTNITPFANYEGADATLVSQWFDTEVETQLFAGAHEEEFLGSDVKGKALYGVASQIRGDNWTGRFSFLNALANYKNEQLDMLRSGLDQVAEFFPAFQGISGFFTIDNQWIQYYSGGAEWEPGRWTITSELTYVDGPEKGLSSRTASGYLSVARQFGKWQPFVVTSRLYSRLNDDASKALLQTYQTVPVGQIAEIDQLRNGAFQVKDGIRICENIQSLGLRHELYPKIAVKGQVDAFQLCGGSLGQMQTRNEGRYVDTALLYSFTLDMVF